MALLLQSDALQRFCFSIVCHILISVTEGLSQGVLHVHLAKVSFLPLSWLLPYSPVAAFFPPLYVLLASHVDVADSLGVSSSISLSSCQPFLVATEQWQIPLCFLSYVMPALYLHSAEGIRIPQEHY